MKKVMITGIGMLTAVGNGKDASWANIKAGKPGVGKITKFDASRCTSQIAAEIRGFEEYAIDGFQARVPFFHLNRFKSGASHEWIHVVGRD